MSPKSTSYRSTSVVAVAMMVMSASASLVDTGRITNGADSAERFSAVDNALDWAQSGGRRLQSSWCVTVSDGDIYCCGFGARASCIARGLEYSGPTTPCEVRLVEDEEGITTCEGLDNSSGNVENCECGELSLDLTPPPSPAATEESATPAPLEEGATPAPVDEDMTPAPLEEGETPAPADEDMTPAPADEDMTPAPVDEDMTPAPVDEDMTPAPTTGDRDIIITPGPTPDSTPSPTEEGMTMAPIMEGTIMTMAPDASGPTPSPTAGDRGISFTATPTASMETTAPTAMTMAPSMAPTSAPTGAPTMSPTMAPTMSTGSPTMAPTMMPTAMPSAGERAIDFGSMAPSMAPTSMPTFAPTASPSLINISDAPAVIDRGISGASSTMSRSGGMLAAATCVVAVVVGRFMA